jgi:hypothetical protein
MRNCNESTDFLAPYTISRTIKEKQHGDGSESAADRKQPRVSSKMKARDEGQVSVEKSATRVALARDTPYCFSPTTPLFSSTFFEEK